MKARYNLFTLFVVLSLVLALTLLSSCGKNGENASNGSGIEAETPTSDGNDVKTGPVESGHNAGLTQNAEGYYEIASAEDFMAFSELLKTYLLDHLEDYSSVLLPQNAVLTADIDLSAYCGAGNSLTPLGGPFIAELYGREQPITGRYAGTFNGNGHTISGIYMDAEELGLEEVGLFAYVGTWGNNWEDRAIVCDLTIADSTFIAGTPRSGCAGSVAARLENGIVNHCVIAETVSVTAGSGGGGIVGYIPGDTTAILLRCENYGHIDASLAGGILGSTSDRTCVVQCDNYGTVAGNRAGGGIIGYHGGSPNYIGLVCGCTNYGEVSGAKAAGGIVGENKSSIRYCINAGTVIGTDKSTDVNAITYNDGSVGVCGNVGTVYSQHPGRWTSAVIFSGSWDMGVHEGVTAEELANIHGYIVDGELNPIGASALTDGTLIAVYSGTKANGWVQGENYPVWDGVSGLEKYDRLREVMGI